MNTDALLHEVQGQEKELKRLRKQVKICNNRIKQLMNQVIANMNESNEIEHTYNGQTYYVEEQSVHSRKANDKKLKDTLSVLEEEGVVGEEAQQIYHKIVSALKGPEKVRQIVKRK